MQEVPFKGTPCCVAKATSLRKPTNEEKKNPLEFQALKEKWVGYVSRR